MPSLKVVVVSFKGKDLVGVEAIENELTGQCPLIVYHCDRIRKPYQILCGLKINSGILRGLVSSSNALLCSSIVKIDSYSLS